MKKFLVGTKDILLLVLCSFCVIPAIAQESGGKPNVFIDYFTRPASVPFLWAENLRSCVIEGISATERVELIDVDSNDLLRIEEERRKLENVVAGDDMERMKVMTSEGANFLIQGTVTSIVTERKKLDDGTPYYSATCAYTLKVINPNNGKLVSTKTFKHGGGILPVTGDNEEEAASKVCKQAIKAVRTLVEDAFKIQGIILEVASERRGKAEEVYISIGSDHGVGEDAFFSACIEREITGGRISQREIGELKVKNVEGGDITLCEVKKGGEEIKKAIDAGQTVVVKSKYKKRISVSGLN